MVEKFKNEKDVALKKEAIELGKFLNENYPRI